MRACLFEDALVSDLRPLTLTRPAFDLLCGCSTLAEKQLRHVGAGRVGALVRPHLADVAREDHPEWAVNDPAWLGGAGVVLLNARWLPPGEGPADSFASPGVGVVGGEVAFAVLGPEQARELATRGLDECLEGLQSALPSRPAGGRMVHYLWELVERAGDEVARDAWHLAPAWRYKHGGLPAVVGPADRLMVDESARIDPYVVADTTGGPVVIDREAMVTAFTRLEGPCYVGPRAQVSGAKVRAGTCLGPQCRIGGEVEASVVLGHSNKVHDGFLGHAYVGEWVNLGAGTHNSDLRNDYGDVSVCVGGWMVRSGRPKVGCFLGDHTKAGLGVLLNTGTHVGAFGHLLPGGGLLPKYVPPFASVWNGVLREAGDLEALLETAAKVMRRRGRELSPERRALYEGLYQQTADERRRAVREAEVRRLRQGA
jgi:UDP-N-acetylglucosamine diphosphorylase/glucosamine-1-phosphate N-acetyltransferase